MEQQTVQAKRRKVSTPRMKEREIRSLHELMANIYVLRLCLNSEGKYRSSGGDLIRQYSDGLETDIFEVAVDLDKMSMIERRRCVKSRLREFEDLIECHQYRRDGHESRLAELEKLFGLTVDETAVLQFAALCYHDQLLSEISDSIPTRNRRQLMLAISNATGISVPEVEKTLRPTSTLMRTGLLRVGRYCDLHDTLSVPSNMAEALFSDIDDPQDVRELLLHRSPKTSLTVGDFAYLCSDVTLITALLRGALSGQHPGINILLHGEPGVGKSELARLIAAECGAAAFSVEDTDSDNDPLDSDGRLGRLLIAQKLLSSGQNQIMILDEAEELLDTEDSSGSLFGFPRRPPSSRQKSWKTRLLEEAPVPTIWIANWTDSIDPALLRRFAYTLEVKRPPRQVRLQMLERAAAGILPVERIRTLLAKEPNLTPADIERARKVVTLTAPATPEDAERHFLMALNTGGNGSALTSPLAKAPDYRVDWINANPPVSTLVERLQATGRGRLCFAGPPGTGKTALARHLADSLDRPLVSKSASDLLSKWVGDTEKSIASAFREARDEGAILLLDEADSFLQDRQGAQHTWEVTQVNELLGQIEAFEGILILCTNRLATLDPAVLRRMDYKVEFACLTAEAAREAFLSAAESLSLVQDEALQVLEDKPIPAGQIAFGDLAAALRQAQLRTDKPSAILLRYCLHMEVEARRQGQGRGIGFVRDSEP